MTVSLLLVLYHRVKPNNHFTASPRYLIYDTKIRQYQVHIAILKGRKRIFSHRLHAAAATRVFFPQILLK